MNVENIECQKNEGIVWACKKCYNKIVVITKEGI